MDTITLNSALERSKHGGRATTFNAPCRPHAHGTSSAHEYTYVRRATATGEAAWCVKNSEINWLK